MTSSSGACASESKEVRLSRRFAIRASRDTRSPRGLIKTYSAAQYRSAVATSALRSASSYSRLDSRSSASALLIAAELDSCAVAVAGTRRISVRNDSKQSRFRIMGASLKQADVRIRYWRDRERDTLDASESPRDRHRNPTHRLGLPMENPIDHRDLEGVVVKLIDSSAVA